VTGGKETAMYQKAIITSRSILGERKESRKSNHTTLKLGDSWWSKNVEPTILSLCL